MFKHVVDEKYGLVLVSRGNIKRCSDPQGGYRTLTTCALESHKTQSRLALTYLYQAIVKTVNPPPPLPLSHINCFTNKAH
jgi:hypothetical protein